MAHALIGFDLFKDSGESMKRRLHIALIALSGFFLLISFQNCKQVGNVKVERDPTKYLGFNTFAVEEDSPGTEVTLEVKNNVEGYKYRWVFANSLPYKTKNGTVTSVDSANGKITYKPDENFNGEDSIEIMEEDFVPDPAVANSASLTLPPVVPGSAVISGNNKTKESVTGVVQGFTYQGRVDINVKILVSPVNDVPEVEDQFIAGPGSSFELSIDDISANDIDGDELDLVIVDPLSGEVVSNGEGIEGGSIEYVRRQGQKSIFLVRSEIRFGTFHMGVIDTHGAVARFKMEVNFDNALMKFKPALALKKMDCMSCHFNINGNMIIESKAWDDRTDYTFQITGKIFAQAGANTDSVVKTLRPPKAVELNKIFIGAPSDEEITRLLNGKKMKYFKRGVDLKNFELSENGKYYQNIPGAITECNGDIVVDAPVYLKVLRLKTDTGCRIYSTHTVFVEGPDSAQSQEDAITYEMVDGRIPEKANLQITSSTAVHLGVGQGSDARRFTSKTSAHLAMVQKGGKIQPRDAGNIGARDINFSRVLINAPRVEDRYTGNFSGVIIAIEAMWALGDFEYSYNSVFDLVGILPLIRTSSIFDVRECDASQHYETETKVVAGKTVIIDRCKF